MLTKHSLIDRKNRLASSSDDRTLCPCFQKKEVMGIKHAAYGFFTVLYIFIYFKKNNQLLIYKIFFRLV